ncbi:MAG TPA: phage tail sheath subtilisin-like domain-containing protein [Longimicrobium sp.]|jgi:hypothetical protein|uniref:phage tail sheath family protein n=1 Tax=Longimicrobium sp. TaxID=2029185 RepID=UPI002EDA632B
MPVTVSYPGVYVQEIASGSHAISGVSTSVTAFVGRAYLGPTNTPTAVSSFAEFQRMFGGLNRGYPLSYAVHDFFQNGGGEAVVVRLYAPVYTAPYTQVRAAGDAAKAALAVVTAVEASYKSAGKTLTKEQSATASAVGHALAQAKYPGGAGNGGGDAVEQAAASWMADWYDSQFAANPTPDVATLNPAAATASGATGAVAFAAPNPDPAAILVAAPAGLADAWTGIQAVITAVWAEVGRTGSPAVTPQTVVQQASAAAALFPAPSTARTAAQALATGVQLYWSGHSDAKPEEIAEQASAPGVPTTSPGSAAQALNAALTLGAAAGAVLNPAVDAAADVFAALGKAVGAGDELDAIREAVKKEAGKFTDGNAKTAADAVEDAVDAASALPANVLAGAGQAVAPALASLFSPLTLTAASPGDWANGALSVSFDQTNVSGPTYFNLRVAYAPLVGSPATEQFMGVSLQPDTGAQRLDRVLANQSNLIRFGWDYSQPPPALPIPGAAGTATGGSAGFPLGLADYLGDANAKTGLYALDLFDLFNLLVVPPDQWPDAAPQPAWMLEVFQTAAAYCRQRRAFLLIDPPPQWTSDWKQGQVSTIQITDLGGYGPEGENAAVYFPNLVEGDPLQNGASITMAPSGALAGIFARTDAARGVWKAPAGINDGAISGVTGVSLRLTNDENGMLNPQGINCLRSFPVYGSVVWGARTLWGSDARSDDYKYVPVRRLALYIEQSLYAGTQWAVFEPNAEPLWSSLRLAVGSFMNGLFAQGAFAGTSASQAYSVRCDATTTTQTDIDNGVVNVLVGFAPLKPAEFVVLSIQQIAGQIQT